MITKRVSGPRAAALFMGAALAACSGGGGGEVPAASAPTVTTFAGSTRADGTGAAARFSWPHGVARNGTDLYVADAYDHTIRRIEIGTGNVTTVAGSAGASGSADGVGSAARFNDPHDVATDGTHLYVTDYGNHTIRRVALATWEVTTLAGTAGLAGFADGQGAAAAFDGPAGIVAVGGVLYVTDYFNHTIRRVEIATGQVTTLAGSHGTPGSTDGAGAAALFNQPYGITALVTRITGSHLYVADYGNHTIRQIDLLTNAVATLAGQAGTPGFADATGGAARFSSPLGVHANPSQTFVWVADWGNQRLRQVNVTNGAVTTAAGGPAAGFADGAPAVARFNGLRGLVGDGTSVWVVDTFNNAVRQVDVVSGTVATLAGPGVYADGAGAAARLQWPSGIASDAFGTSFVADRDNHVIRWIAPDGTVGTLAGLAGAPGGADGTGRAARFSSPRGVATNADGTVYVADTGNHTIRMVTSAGVVTTVAGLAGTPGGVDGTGAAARFSSPSGLAVDTAGNLYVADSGNHAIRKITPAGVVSTLAGRLGSLGMADGTVAARFYVPRGVAVDARGDVYVADTGNHTIRKVTPAGAVSTLAGLGGTRGSADGTGAAARFWFPSGVAVDSAGNVHVADTSNHAIRLITPSGAVSTPVGLSGNPGSADGAGAAARFSDPVGVAAAGGRLLVADARHGLIRTIR